MDRRRFLATSAAALALPRRARGVAAADTLTVAHIGVGGMGTAHLSWFAGFRDVEIAALCDVDSERLGAAMRHLDGLRPGHRAEAVGDFRRILDRPDIDVITTATPDHWHALIATLAMQAGKDVYGEKPLSHNWREAKAMETVARRTGRIFQLGTQIHAGDNYHRVVELVRSGALGKIHTVHLWKPGGSGGLEYAPDQDPPATLDWDMWLGPAPARRYNPRICPYQFRHFWDYSGGVYADFWCHIADIAFWALDIRAPVKTVAARGETPAGGMAETPAWIDVDYTFADGLKLFWTTNKPAGCPSTVGEGIGCWFEGTAGSLVCDYDRREIILGGEKLDDLPDVPQSVPRSPGHPRNFLDCVRSREQPESNIAYARRMATPLYFGEISFRLGRPLTWDPASETFVGDDVATRLLGRPYRAPWVLPA